MTNNELTIDGYSFEHEIPVFSVDAYPHLLYSTRKGQFNLLSSEESYSTNFAVRTSTGKLVASCNASPDYEINGTDIDEAIEAIKEEIAARWIDTARDRKKIMLSFITRWQEQLKRNNRLEEIAIINKRLDRDNIRKQELIASLES